MAFDFTAALNVQTNPANLNKVNKDIQKSLDKVSLNLDAKNIAKAQGEVKKLQGTLSKTKSVATEFGEAVSLKAVNFAAYTIASTAVLKLTSAVSNATRESLKLQAELAKIAQVTNKSNKEIFAQAKLLKQISVEYNIASSKVAQLTRTLAQTGLSFQQAAKAAEVLARTSLLATFDSLQSTTEGFIATLSSFSLSVDQAGQSLEAINAVSKRFAVESSDIVEAIRRTGGAFDAAGGNVNELIALFTAVRSTSRESAETIATGFRTIFGRLQRPKTIEFFKELGIQLETAEGQFVGPLQAIQNISRGLDRLNISVGSTKFAEVVEQIGGIRQLSRVVPLLTQTEKITSALGVANDGTAESAEDVAKAQGTLAFQIGQLQKNFSAFIDDVVSSPGFQLLAKSIIGIANALIEVGRALTPLIPLFAVLATVKLSKGLSSLIGGKGGGGGGGLKGLLGFNAGGFVPGSGNRDTVPAMLTPGEFVIRKSAAQAFGAENLQAINKYKGGGLVGIQKAVSTGNAYDGDTIGVRITPTEEAFETRKTRLLGYDAFEINRGSKEETDKGKLAKQLANQYYKKDTDLTKQFKNAPNQGTDKFGRFFWQDDAFGQQLIAQGLAVPYSGSGQRATQGKTKKQRKNAGGSISGVGTDTVPALLTPGEFVVNKKSAQAFGYGNLKEVNKYAKGGVVQKFQAGGLVGGGGGGDSDLFSEVLGLGTAFATVSVSSAAYQDILIQGGTSVKNAFSGLVSSIGDTIKERKELNQSIRNSEISYKEAAAKQVEAAKELDNAVADLEISKAGFQQFDPSQVQRDIDATLPGLPDASPLRGGDLAKAQSELKARYKAIAKEYKNDEDVTKALGKIKSQLRGSTKKQNAALDALTNRLADSTKAAESRVKAAKKNVDALNAETKARQQEIKDLKRKKRGSFFKGIFGGGDKNLSKEEKQAKLEARFIKLAQAVDLAANVILAKLIKSINDAAAVAGKLKEQAIASGDIEAAKEAASKEASKKTEAQITTQSAALWSGVGAGIGALFGPMGIAIGAVIGKLIGMAKWAQKVTRWFASMVGIDLGESARKAREEAAAQATANLITQQNQLAQQTISLARELGGLPDELSALSDTTSATAAAFLNLNNISISERKKTTLGLESFGLNNFKSAFKQIAVSNSGKDPSELLAENADLAAAFNNLKSVATNGSAKMKIQFDALEQSMKNMTVAVANLIPKLNEYDQAQNSINLALGNNINVFDALGDQIPATAKKELQSRQRILDSFAKLEKKRSSILLKLTNSEANMRAKLNTLLRTESARRSKFRPQDIASNVQDQLEKILNPLNQGTPGDVLKDLGASPKEQLNTLFDKLKAVREEQRNAVLPGGKGPDETTKEFQKRLSVLGRQADRYRGAIEALTKGTQEVIKATIEEAKVRSEAKAALEDFKGGLIEDFAFATDKERDDLGRSAALTAQAVQQGGIQNIASEDRGAVKSFLDRLPQNIKLDTLRDPRTGEARTAGRVKAEFAADEAIRKGIIRFDQRDEFVRNVEQQGKPIEERIGTAYEKAVLAGLYAEQDLLDLKEQRELELLDIFGTYVDLFGIWVASLDPGSSVPEDTKKEKVKEAIERKKAEIKEKKEALEQARIGEKGGGRSVITTGGRQRRLAEEEEFLQLLKDAKLLTEERGKFPATTKDPKSKFIDPLIASDIIAVAQKNKDESRERAAKFAGKSQLNIGDLTNQIKSQEEFVNKIKEADAALRETQSTPLEEFVAPDFQTLPPIAPPPPSPPTASAPPSPPLSVRDAINQRPASRQSDGTVTYDTANRTVDANGNIMLGSGLEGITGGVLPIRGSAPTGPTPTPAPTPAPTPIPTVPVPDRPPAKNFEGTAPYNDNLETGLEGLLGSNAGGTKVDVGGDFGVNVQLDGNAMGAVLAQVYKKVSDEFKTLSKRFENSQNPSEQATFLADAGNNLDPSSNT